MKYGIKIIALILLISIAWFIRKIVIATQAAEEGRKAKRLQDNKIKWAAEKERIEAQNRQRQQQAKPVYQDINKGHWSKAFLMSIEWKLFEDVCMEYLRIKNCDANVTNIGKDGGIDLKITDNAGNVIAIGQCKAWSEKNQVNVKEVRELYGIMAAEKVRHGIYITTSSFTKDAQEFSINKPLLLINGDDFIKNIMELDEASRTRLDKIARVSGYNIPTCPNCNVKMIKKVSQKGSNQGNVFWGCSNYPRCRNTLQVRKEVSA
ncbi:MAG: restriction endonuclease [Methylococcales bacterium]|nr:restriction endonuclease [Methylococcales bacterium]